MGQVCAKHTQYYEERCPYCEGPDIELPYAPIDIPIIVGPPAPLGFSSIVAAIIDARIAMMEANAKKFDEPLRRAMMPPNDGHGAFE